MKRLCIFIILLIAVSSIVGGVVMADYPDFEGQKSGVSSPAELAAIEGTDVEFIIGSLAIVAHGSVTDDYIVPAGKILFITDASFALWGNALADSDLNQVGYIDIYNVTTAKIILLLGGNGGGGISLQKPKRISAGQTVSFVLSNQSNHVADGYATFCGYLK